MGGGAVGRRPGRVRRVGRSPSPLRHRRGLSFGIWVFEVVGVAGSGLVWAVVGAVLVTLRPRNVLGWLVLGLGLGVAWASGMQSYGYQGIAAGWPAAEAVDAAGYFLFAVSQYLMITFLLLSTPTGGCPAHGGAVAAAVVIVSPVQSNYFVIEERAGRSSRTWWRSSGLGTSVAAWAGAVVRLVRARPPQRQQQAWLVLVVVPCAVWNMFFASIPGEGGGGEPPGDVPVGSSPSSSRPWRWRWGCCGTGCWGSSRCCGAGWCTGR